MPIFLAHLRWDGLSPRQLDAVQRMVDDERSSPGCCSLTTRTQGSALTATAVWDSSSSMLAFNAGPLNSTTAAVGLSDPTVALFTVSDLFAAGYRPRASVTLPAPRPAGEQQIDLVGARERSEA